MNSYKNFANYYDRLMREDVEYEKIADFIENIFTEYDIEPNLICDLACGTGNITIPMSKRGYEMIGIDKSVEMLEVARNKASSENCDILFLNQSITKLDLFGTCDAFLCMIDGVNYILNPHSFENMLNKINTCFINPDGLFIFDISSFNKLSKTIGNNTFIHDGDDIFYSWENKYYDNKHLIKMYLNFFVKDKKGYRRFCERHIQRAYTENEIKDALKRAGFTDIKTYDGFNFKKPTKNSQRITFVCRKK